MKNVKADIAKFHLDTALYKRHKKGMEKSDFGMDGTNELIENGFGLYSTADLKTPIGPVKAQYFRIAITVSGTVQTDCGLETFTQKRNSIIFGFPGPVFSLYNPDRDYLAYYMLFSEQFITELLPLKVIREDYPFMNYSGVQSFQLTNEEAGEVMHCIWKINDEVKSRKQGFAKAIRLYIHLIMLLGLRGYERQFSVKTETTLSGNALFRRFIKSVNQHFLTMRKVADYAAMLHVSSDHLNRTIKIQSGKTAHELIDEMIFMEAKAYLLHTDKSVAEIGYQLEFSDPSHFNKFFKKLAGCTPLQFRAKSSV